MSVVLNKLGYQSKFVANGKEALSALENENFSIVFMGMQMPEIGCMEATRHIRTTNGYQPFIVAVTANALGVNKENYLQAGIDECLTKPINISTLLDILKKASGNRVRD